MRAVDVAWALSLLLVTGSAGCRSGAKSAGPPPGAPAASAGPSPENAGPSPESARPPLADVPIGSWSEYAIKQSDRPGARLRIALPAREHGAGTIEYALRAVDGPPLPDVTMQMTYAPGEGVGATPRSSAVQVGDHPPMQQPPEASAGAGAALGAADGMTWVTAREDVTVPAGSFEAAHLRQRRNDGGTLDMWLSRAVFPIGIVRLRETSADGHTSTTELERTGGGAAPRVRGTPRPYDQSVLAREVVASLPTPVRPAPTGLPR